MSRKTCLGVLYLLFFLAFFLRVECLEPILESVTTHKPSTISPFGNITLPLLSNASSHENPAATTMFPSHNATVIPALGNFTLPTFATLAALNLSNLPTLPPMANFTMPTFGTLAPFNMSNLPTLPGLMNFTIPSLNLGNFSMGTLPPLNLTFPVMPTFGTLAPLNLSNLPTIPGLGNFTIPTFGTMAPLNLSNLPTLPTFGTMAPLNLSNLPTLPGMGNFTIPTFGTMAPLNLSNLPTIPGLGNFTIPTFGTMAPLNLSNLPTIPGLGNFTLPTFATLPPLNLSNLPTLPPMPTIAPLGNFTFGTLPTIMPLVNFTLPTIPSIVNMTMPSLFPGGSTAAGTGNGTVTPVLLGGVTVPSLGNGTMLPGNMTMMSTTHAPAGNVTMMNPISNLTVVPVNVTMLPMMTTTRAAGNMTMLPTLIGNLTMLTTPHLPIGNMTVVPANMTMMPMVTTTRAPGAAPVGNATTGNMTMMPGMTTTKPAAAGNMSMTTTQKPFLTACGATGCTPQEVCVSPFNSSQTCIKRLPDRRYCIDNPCATGMKCFDNVTSNAYTCYTKLGRFNFEKKEFKGTSSDGTAGECLGIQCSPGDICYQVMGQAAKCIQLHQAPRCLGQNEEFSACKSGCESTCAEPSPACMNSTTCTSGCACIRGYARINGVCELMSKCGSSTTGNITCSGTEMYTPCKPVCEKSCSGVPNMACLSMNSTTLAPPTCTPGCTCRNAYKRDKASGQCVHARQCFQATTCGANESWSKCHNCESMCGQTVNPSCKTCWSGCGCNPGYSRSTSGTCVESAKCS
ncbi:hypothetical protein CAEBREN_30335 [Caenorhabditis brenneri]|uniref:TIL domain-containing protein n=1 Tax=Caenorhabditis brenneri TaxID=135651 RepID=G0P063_CAEBE|nr:hypothetical protein CAEBREN_30335 [Caenorhabditis brenneri]